MRTRFIGAFAAFSVSILALVLAPSPAGAQRGVAKFDGLWSVLVITEAGTCDRAYRYGVRIANGQIMYAGEAGIRFFGEVKSNGSVTVTVQSGDRTASGTGKLSTVDGGGTWFGTSPSNRCSGTWEAERR
jgi:hypothetical protein